MNFLNQLYELSEETETQFNQHFIAHYSPELIAAKKAELLSVPFPEDLKKYLGREWKSTIRKMYPVVEKLYNFAPHDIQMPFFISQVYWANLLNIKRTTLTEYLKQLKKIGIIICLEDTYTFETEKTIEIYPSCYDFSGYCKYYLCNKENCIKFISEYKNNITDNIVNKELNDNISVGTQKKKTVIDNNKKYFGLSRTDINSIIADINIDLPEYEKFSLSQEKEFSRIYCPFCSLPTEEHFSEKRLKYQLEYHTCFTREEYLRTVNNTEWRHWDRKASVPFITRLVNKNIITPNDYDLYKDLNGKDFKSKEERDAFKYIFMRLYFSKSVKQCISQTKRKWQELFYGVNENGVYKKGSIYSLLVNNENSSNIEDIIIDERHKRKIQEAKNIFILCMKKEFLKNKDISKEKQLQLIADYIREKYNNVEKVLGKRLGNEVFMYESSLYLQVYQKLKNEQKINVKQCYDSFYYQSEKEYDIMSILENVYLRKSA